MFSGNRMHLLVPAGVQTFGCSTEEGVWDLVLARTQAAAVRRFSHSVRTGLSPGR
jgi:hypothetical protein